MASFRFTLFLSLVTLLGMCARIVAAFTCPSIDWVLHEGNCYRVYSGPMTFVGAEAFCQIEDPSAHLVSIHSGSENTLVHNVFSSISLASGDRMWIGLNKPAGKPSFEWSDGSTSAYTYPWATNEPVAVPGHAAVVLIPPWNTESSKWEVASADSNQDYFMCKKPASNI